MSKLTILVNLGTPDQPYEKEVRKYLKEFLSDKYVIRLPRLFWLTLLNFVILRTRPKKSAELYRKVWTDWGSPLLFHTYAQTGYLRHMARNLESDVYFDTAMRYGNPSVKKILYESIEKGYKDITILPMFPQYSTTTTLSIFELIKQLIKKDKNYFSGVNIQAISSFHDNNLYIKACADKIKSSQKSLSKPDKLLFSFHGIPESYIGNDEPYQEECLNTAHLIAQELKLSKTEYEIAFQSRFGKAEWIKPYLSARLEELPKEGVKNLHVFCPGFSSDCLETIDEIGRESKEDYFEHGGKEFTFIPCLNSDEQFIKALMDIQATPDTKLL
jgi:ferrochelatase